MTVAANESNTDFWKEIQKNKKLLDMNRKF